MKILFVIGFLAPRYGGSVASLVGLSEQVADKGHKVTIYTTNIDDNKNLDVPLDRPVSINNVEIHYFPVQWPRYYKTSLAMGRTLKKTILNFDIVHIFSIYSFHNLATAYYCRKYHVPYILNVHGSLDPFLLRKHAFRKKVYTALFERRYWDTAAASRYSSREEMLLVSPLGIEAPGVIIPEGLNFREYSQLPPYGEFRERYPVLKEKKILLFLSRINFKKGLDILAKAFGEIVRTRDDVYLVVVGSDDECYGDEVKKWLAEEGALDRTIFTGMLLGQDKLAVFRDSDVFVLPSHTENFGIVVIEALACKLPVVISNKVNIWREITEADAGMVVNCDPEELAEALLKLLDDPERCRRLGENGYQLVQEEFTWDKVTDQMIEVYEDVLNGKL